MLKVRLLIAGPDPVRDSLLFINDELKTFPDEKQRGLKEKLDALFATLHNTGVVEVIAYGKSNWNAHQKTVDTILSIDPLRLLFADEWIAPVDSSELATRGREVVTLIAWLSSECFERLTATSRRCVICGSTQHGNIMGYANLSGTPYVHWVSCYCLNPECLSHTIEKMIDPDYEIPKEAFEERGRKSLFQEGIEKALKQHPNGIPTEDILRDFPSPTLTKK